jgi:hypothetical protein
MMIHLLRVVHRRYTKEIQHCEYTRRMYYHNIKVFYFNIES